jgi:hypothetical protein
VIANVIHAPQRPFLDNRPSVFLAGSIEMGAAVDWQSQLIAALAEMPIRIYNPRRPDWDSSWKQTRDDPRFREQVEWELDHLERADVIALYLDPATKSPISLLELGLFADSDKLIVCCPEGFWRKGNVDIVCERYGINHCDNFPELVCRVRNNLLFHC